MSFEQLRDQLEIVLCRGTGAGDAGLVAPLEPIEAGWASTQLFTTTLTYPDAASTDLVIKLYGADAAGAKHAAREAGALERLSAAGLRVPAVVSVDAGASAVGHPLLAMERVAGVSFWSRYEVADPRSRAALTAAFAEQLVRLHALSPRLLTADDDHVDPFAAVDAELAALRLDAAAPEHSGLRPVVDWLHAGRDAVPCSRRVILHRDYHPWNVLVDQLGHLWVLDWDWQIGDARFDVAWTCTLLRRSGHDAFSAAVRAEYARQTDGADAGHDYFEVLTTARWLMNVLPALGPQSQLLPHKREAFRAFLTEPLQRAYALLEAHTGLIVNPYRVCDRSHQDR